jgi:predicted TIM-barrel fold metal-dependent hydrolase
MTDQPIVDAHHHIWKLDAVPWLKGPQVPRIFGDYGPLRRDHLVGEYLGNCRAQGVERSVFIQINVAPGAEAEEVAWAQSVADTHGFPHGIVGYADLAAPGLADVLDRQGACANLRGIRQQLHWHENPLYRFATTATLMKDPAWLAGLAELDRRRLSFDLQVFTSQMADAAELARAFPETLFILQHAGMLEDRSPEGWQAWRAGMRQLAACPNVVSKLSGLGTFEHACSVELWRPVVLETLEIFGVARCLFGSNWPIETLWTDYAAIVGTMRECLIGLTREERAAVLHDNALRVYRL